MKNDLSNILATIIIFTLWIAGVVLAHGAWSTVFAICFPPWGFYLIIEKLMQMAGIIP